MYRYYNPNPCGKAVGDCVIRAVSTVVFAETSGKAKAIAIHTDACEDSSERGQDSPTSSREAAK